MGLWMPGWPYKTSTTELLKIQDGLHLPFFLMIRKYLEWKPFPWCWCGTSSVMPHQKRESTSWVSIPSWEWCLKREERGIPWCSQSRWYGGSTCPLSSYSNCGEKSARQPPNWISELEGDGIWVQASKVPSEASFARGLMLEGGGGGTKSIMFSFLHLLLLPWWLICPLMVKGLWEQLSFVGLLVIFLYGTSVYIPKEHRDALVHVSTQSFHWINGSHQKADPHVDWTSPRPGNPGNCI